MASTLELDKALIYSGRKRIMINVQISGQANNSTFKIKDESGEQTLEIEDIDKEENENMAECP